MWDRSYNHLLVLPVTLQKTIKHLKIVSQCHPSKYNWNQNFSLQKYLSSCDLNIMEALRNFFLQKRRAFFCLNQRIMSKEPLNLRSEKAAKYVPWVIQQNDGTVDHRNGETFQDAEWRNILNSLVVYLKLKLTNQPTASSEFPSWLLKVLPLIVRFSRGPFNRMVQNAPVGDHFRRYRLCAKFRILGYLRDPRDWKTWATWYGERRKASRCFQSLWC